jgi:ubiquinone/menaquinone biosynthesis C-methylase UbiE
MEKQYILNTDELARERLDIQHGLYLQSSLNLLEQAGIKAGMNGLEIGSGSGAMTLELAKRVTKDGKILSIDMSQEQLDAASKRLADYPQVAFKQHDVNSCAELNQKFDFIYCRMVLVHVEDASSAIKQMITCLKPGGLLICEEPPLFDALHCYPHSRYFRQCIDLSKQLFEASRRDIEIAYRLNQEMLENNLSIEHQGLFQPMLTTEKEKMLYPLAAKDVAESITKIGILSEEEVQHFVNGLSEMVKDATSISWLRMHQVVARKA